MARDPDMEALRDLFDKDRVFLSFGKILQLALAKDNSVWRAKVSLFPDEREVAVDMTWEQVGPKCGSFGPASVGDMVLIAFANGDEDYGFVIRRLSSKEDIIPKQAGEGHNYNKALPGKKNYLGSDVKTIIGKLGEGADPIENLVLGQQLKALLIDILAELKDQADTLASHTHIGNMGGQTSPPNESADITAHGAVFDAKKASPVGDEIILSDVVFTEKGS